MELDLIEDQVFQIYGLNVLILGVDMSSSAHIDNKNKDILVLGKGSTQGLEHILTAEKMYLMNFAITRKKFCLSLHCNGGNNLSWNLDLDDY